MPECIIIIICNPYIYTFINACVEFAFNLIYLFMYGTHFISLNHHRTAKTKKKMRINDCTRLRDRRETKINTKSECVLLIYMYIH